MSFLTDNELPTGRVNNLDAQDLTQESETIEYIENDDATDNEELVRK